MTAYRVWFKSTYSDGTGGNCVEVALHPRTVHIRDSKATENPHLAVSPAAWSAFVEEAGRRAES